VLAPDRTDLHRPMGWLLPDDRDLAGADYAKLVLCTTVLGLGAVAVSAGRGRSTGRPAGPAPAVSRTSR